MRPPGSIPAHAGEPNTLRCSRHWSRVYPRARGGTRVRYEGEPQILGLSPRTRGNHTYACGAPRDAGSIPAHAGEPFHCSESTLLFRVYPRARGGTVLADGKDLQYLGLSPRTRGNLGQGARRVQLGGSIPVHAGEPAIAHPAIRCPRVYPRARGGTIRTAPVSTLVLGLSPRTRGNHVPAKTAADVFGSIPAHAGEPPGTPCTGARSRVYPRARGGTGSRLVER